MEGGSDFRPKLRIVADHREANADVIGHLCSLPEVALEFRQLTTGDYEVEECCVFERKSIRDFAMSIVDGRLFSQATRLSKYDRPAAIIIEGHADEIGTLGVRRESLQGAVISLSLVFHITVLRSSDPRGNRPVDLLCRRTILPAGK